MALWTPNDIDTALWLDAADEDTITLDGDDNVEQWDDKSGNNRHATQGTSANRPEYNDTAHVLEFDGANDFMQTASWGDQSQPNTVFIVAKHPPNDETQRFIFDGIDNTKRHAWLKQGHPHGSDIFDRFAGESTFTTITSLSGSRELIGLEYNTATGNTFLNGALISTNTDNGSHVWSGITIGARSTGADPHLGDIAEIIVLFSAANTETRQKIEGYLAHKWGLEDELPVDHPYKAGPPKGSDIDVDSEIAITSKALLMAQAEQAVDSEIAITSKALLMAQAEQAIEVGIGVTFEAFNWQDWKQINQFRAVPRYFLVLSADGQESIDVPMDSWQVSNDLDTSAYGECIIRDITYYPAIAARVTGTMAIQMAWVAGQEMTPRETLFRGQIEDVRTDMGGRAGSIGISGRQEQPVGFGFVRLTTVTYRSLSNGRLHYRCATPDLFLRPGHTATYKDDLFDDSFTVGRVTYYVSQTQQQMDVIEI